MKITKILGIVAIVAIIAFVIQKTMTGGGEYEMSGEEYEDIDIE